MAQGLTLYPKRKDKGLVRAVGGEVDSIVEQISNTSVNNVPDASTITKGIIEIATTAETSAGTDSARAVCPLGLIESRWGAKGEKMVYLKVIAEGTALATATGAMYFTVPDILSGMNLVDADAAVYTVSSSGTPTIDVRNDTDGTAMLSTKITIDINEKTSYTAGTPPVVDTTKDDVVIGDSLRIDVDVAGTGTKGLDVFLTFQLP